MSGEWQCVCVSGDGNLTKKKKNNKAKNKNDIKKCNYSIINLIKLGITRRKQQQQLRKF